MAKVRLGRRTPLRRRQSYRVVDWDEVPQLFVTSEVAAEAARLRDMHPSDVAHLVRNLPLAQRKQLAEAMEDERLADLLEELPEAEQLRLIEGLDLERLVSVLEEMEYDDAADLLAEMSGEQRSLVLGGHGRGRRRHAAPPALLRRGHRRRPHEPRRHHPRPDLHGRRGPGPHP